MPAAIFARAAGHVVLKIRSAFRKNLTTVEESLIETSDRERWARLEGRLDVLTPPNCTKTGYRHREGAGFRSPYLLSPVQYPPFSLTRPCLASILPASCPIWELEPERALASTIPTSAFLPFQFRRVTCTRPKCNWTFGLSGARTSRFRSSTSGWTDKNPLLTHCRLGVEGAERLASPARRGWHLTGGSQRCDRPRFPF